MLIIEDSGSGRTNTLLNLIKQHDDDDYSIIDKFYLYVNILLKKHEKILKVQRLLLNIQLICRMFIKIMMSTTQAENLM